MALSRAPKLRGPDPSQIFAAPARDLHGMANSTLVSGDPACRPCLSPHISAAKLPLQPFQNATLYQCLHIIHIIAFEKVVLTAMFNTPHSYRLEVLQPVALAVEVSQLSSHPSTFGGYICLICFKFGRPLSCPRLGPAHGGLLCFRMLV